LWPSEESLNRGNIDECFTLINTLPHEQELTARTESMVIIIGMTFRDVLTGQVDFGACSQVGLYVEAVE
jgi:hypothetical protein